MNLIKWKFLSKYKKLMYNIKCAKANKQRLHLSDGIIFNFENNTIEYNRKEEENI